MPAGPGCHPRINYVIATPPPRSGGLLWPEENSCSGNSAQNTKKKNMKKIFVLSLLFYSMASMAITVDDFNNVCGLYAYDNMYATFAPDSYSCESGQFLPANGVGCANCLAGFSCAGGTFDFDEYFDQGLVFLGTNYTINENNACANAFPKNLNAKFEPDQYTCNAGYYLPADGIACVQCPANSFCSGGTYTYNESITQGISGQCANGYSAPVGSSSSADCIANTITVRWDDGNGGAYSTTCTYGGVLTTPTTEPVAPRGYHFTGWSFNLGN